MYTIVKLLAGITLPLYHAYTISECQGMVHQHNSVTFSLCKPFVKVGKLLAETKLPLCCGYTICKQQEMVLLKQYFAQAESK